MSKRNRAVCAASLMGYRVRNGKVYNKKGKTRTLYVQSRNSPYLCFTIWLDGKSWTVPVHKLVALQKFGTGAFKKNVVVRHLNDNRADNTFHNIKIGTSKDNATDRKHNIFLENQFKHVKL